MKRFQLMQRVNPEGLYGAVQAALPYLNPADKQGRKRRGRAGEGGRIVVVCPPIYSRFFRGKTAYAMGKVGMSVLVKGLAMDLEREGVVGGWEEGSEGGVGIGGLWPAVVSSSGFPFFSFSCVFSFSFLG